MVREALCFFAQKLTSLAGLLMISTRSISLRGTRGVSFVLPLTLRASVRSRFALRARVLEHLDLASSSMDSHVRIWDLEKGSLVNTIEAFPVETWAVAWSRYDCASMLPY